MEYSPLFMRRGYKLLVSFCIRCAASAKQPYDLCIYTIRAGAVRVARVVVVDIAGSVDIPNIVRVAAVS
ncbi:MAG: hypothetical protein ACI4EA_08470 [Candidatus Ornithomonoglobus sp.]